MGYNRQLKWVLPPLSCTTSNCDNYTWSVFLDQLGSLMILTFSYIYFHCQVLPGVRMSMHPGSWLRFAAILAAVFTFFTVLLLRVNTCVKGQLPNSITIHYYQPVQYNRCEVESMKASLGKGSKTPVTEIFR